MLHIKEIAAKAAELFKRLDSAKFNLIVGSVDPETVLTSLTEVKTLYEKYLETLEECPTRTKLLHTKDLLVKTIDKVTSGCTELQLEGGLTTAAKAAEQLNQVLNPDYWLKYH